MVTGIIIAGGRSERMGKAGVDKCFLTLGPRPVVVWSLLAFQTCEQIDQIVLVTRKEQMNAARILITMFGLSKLAHIVAGGKNRQESVMAGLKAMDPDTRFVCIHDGARPCVKPELITATVESAKKHDSGVAASRITDTVKMVGAEGVVSKTLDRSVLWAVQTPQAFKATSIQKAYQHVVSKKQKVTDDAGAMEAAGMPVRVVEWNECNLKITHAADLGIAAAVLQLTPQF